MIALFDPELVIARIAGEVGTLRKVAGAAGLTAAAEDLRQPPAAYVIALQDAAAPNAVVGAVAQRVTARFGVLLAAQNLRDARGQAAADALRPLRLALLDALLGWAPGTGYDPCTYAGGRLMAMTDRVLWWQDDFLTTLYLRKV